MSAATGDGLTEFFSAVDAATSEYERLLIYTANILRLWYKKVLQELFNLLAAKTF